MCKFKKDNNDNQLTHRHLLNLDQVKSQRRAKLLVPVSWGGLMGKRDADLTINFPFH